VTTVVALVVLVLVLLAVGRWLSLLAARLATAQARVERSWRMLDSALADRAERALALAWHPTAEPATTLLVGGAAAAALEPELTRQAREEVESRLSQVLVLTRLPGLDPEQQRAALARRLHNDSVTVAASLRRRQTVRLLRLAGEAAEPRAFEMMDGQELVWSGGLPR
jgi:hypothetical protein